jgi:glycosyltransferase involved in cell wall biosynthesis
VIVIENGFDKDLLDSVNKEETDYKINCFVICYSGSLQNLRTPQYFLEAIKLFTDKNPDFLIKIQLVGFIDHSHKELISSIGLSDIVSIVENVSQKKAFEYMVNSNLLLLLQRQSDGGNTAIPGKLYEYLATGIPVITIDEGGGASTKFLNELGLSSEIDFTNPQAILSEIEYILNNYELLVERHQQIQKTMGRYSRRHEAYKLATIVRKIINKDMQTNSEILDME